MALGLSIGMVVAVLSPAFAFAVETSPTQEPTKPITSTETKVVPSDSKSELAARLQNRKAKLQTRLSNEESARLGNRCVAAQKLFAGVGKKFVEKDTPQRAKYDAYIARLQRVIQKADAEGLDTTDLKKNMETFSQKHQAMIAAINDFNLSISDLQSIDCKSDPTSFKATLESARASLKDVQAAREELGKIAKGPVQESIKALKAALEAKKKS